MSWLAQRSIITEENAHLLQKPCFQGAIQSLVATAGRPEEPSGVTLTHGGLGTPPDAQKGI